MIDAIRNVIAGDSPVFLLIAGPNGAGKSTFREKRLEPLRFPCIDPDKVGRELFEQHPETKEKALLATQEATKRVRSFFRDFQSIALETVFSDSRGYKLSLINEAHIDGFKTILIFIGVDDTQVCIARVMDRVGHGGHDVPDDIIEKRFPKCFENLKSSIKIVDLVLLVDNSGCYGSENSPQGLRHYVFGLIHKGKQVELSNPVPSWFHYFGISDVIQP